MNLSIPKRQRWNLVHSYVLQTLGKDESVNGLEAALDDIQDITQNNPKSSIVVAGDFNAKEIQWDTLSISPKSNKKTVCEKIINTLNESHLHQLQRVPTWKDAMFDLSCTNKPGLVKSPKTKPGISDHDGIILDDMELMAQTNKKPSRMVPI